MRRLDQLILKAFFGPFFLTTIVATFILLIQYMLKYFDDFVGKNLGFAVFAELLFYFSLNMLQVALPLGVLVSSLMTFGNLGEHFELTAIKSAGISLIRTMRPLFVFVVFLSIGAFYFNDYVVPAANLKAYSLLYDIKHKKPALDIKAGVFYDGIPNYSIKAGDKLPDNKTLLDVMIYDHTLRDGNKRVILADSSIMYTIYNEKYLKLELFNGVYYNEAEKPKSKVDDFYRTSFDRLDIVFSLSSFDLKRTKEELFRNNRQMKNIAELSEDIDSLRRDQVKQLNSMGLSGHSYLNLHLPKYYQSKKEEMEVDTINQANDSTQVAMISKASMIPAFLLDVFESNQLPLKKRIKSDTLANIVSKLDSLNVNEDLLLNKKGSDTLIKKNRRRPLDEWTLKDLEDHYTSERTRQMIIQDALNQARNYKVNITGVKIKAENMERNIDSYTIEKYKKYSQAFACLVMFLIGAPLGAIIKKGGLGVPVIVSIFFFIIYYVLTITSEKWAKANLIEGEGAVWIADIVLLPFGLFFLRQARIDARLFDTDFYLVVIEKLKTRLNRNK